MKRHPWKTGALFGNLVGLSVAAVMMYVAWEHNLQGEIHNEDGVSWAYWFLIGLSWFIPVAVPLSLVSGALLRWLLRSDRSGAA
jgi:hypothetical protein